MTITLPAPAPPAELSLVRLHYARTPGERWH